MQEEWRQRPPVHHLVAAYLDYKPRDQAVIKVDTDISPMLGALGGEIPVRTAAPIDTSAFDAHQREKRGSDG